MHLLKIFLIITLALTFQNCSLTSDSICSTPQCSLTSWICRTRMVLMWCTFGRIIGFMASVDIGVIDILPPTCMTSAFFMTGFSLIILLKAFTVFPSFRPLTSLGKLLFLTSITIFLFALSGSSLLIPLCRSAAFGSFYFSTRHFIQSRNLSTQATFRNVRIQ